MINKEELARLLEYNVWANHRMLRVSALLSVDAFTRNLGASHGGVRGTLVHVMAMEELWLARWMGSTDVRIASENDFASLMTLRDHWTSVEEKRQHWFDALPPGSMTQVVRYTTTTGEAYEVPLWKLIQNVLNHSTYHRGQLTVLFRLVGAKPAVTDLLVWDLNRDGPWGGSAALGPGGTRGL
jgi:uncharacterized damage-inducible protein DinB